MRVVEWSADKQVGTANTSLAQSWWQFSAHRTWQSLDVWKQPLLLSTRIKEDIRKTRNQAADPQWDLPPDDLRPKEHGSGLPTANLLAWGSATTLTAEQLSSLEGAGITEDDFSIDNNQFQMSRPHFELIADKVRTVTRRQTRCIVPWECRWISGTDYLAGTIPTMNIPILNW